LVAGRWVLNRYVAIQIKVEVCSACYCVGASHSKILIHVNANRSRTFFFSTVLLVPNNVGSHHASVPTLIGIANSRQVRTDTGHIFGGYTCVPWSKGELTTLPPRWNRAFHHDESSFVFRLTSPKGALPAPTHARASM
jgi:hypothetical protein